MKKITRLLKLKKGFVTVTTAAMMVSLIGMAALATDVGVLYVNHSQLENMTDSGALAGAQEYFFNQSQVEAVATDFAMRNGKTGDTINAWVDTDGMKVYCSANRNVDLYLAKVLNINTANVTSVSAAKIAAVSGTSNAWPFGITWDDSFLPEGSAAGQQFTLKVDEKEEFKGNFHVLRLKSKSGGDSGASVVEENIVYGCAQVLKIGDKVNTEPGNMTGPIKKGISDRLAIEGGNIVIIPVIEETWTDLGGGVEQVTVKAFAAFEVDSSNGKTVTGRFIRLVSGPAEQLSDGASLYGLYGTRLVEP
ncbi:MAG: hypothetical protein GX451_09400 [Acholeplasmataceae bacterium]|nr:hypothetical protein [Acholeplasmataceae bacterium]